MLVHLSNWFSMQILWERRFSRFPQSLNPRSYSCEGVTVMQLMDFTCKNCELMINLNTISLRWRNNGRDSVSNHQPHDCLLNSLFRHRSKKTSKLRVTGLCAGNSPGTGEFPAQVVSNAENVSIGWRHHDAICWLTILRNYIFFSYIVTSISIRSFVILIFFISRHFIFK